MRKGQAILAAVLAFTFVFGIGGAWAEGKVTITREENKPKNVEVKAGEEVRFINSSGQTAHVWFGGNEAVRFYVPSGSGGAKVKFDTNAAVLLNPKLEPIGTRIFGPVTRELRNERFMKIVSLAPEVL